MLILKDKTVEKKIMVFLKSNDFCLIGNIFNHINRIIPMIENKERFVNLLIDLFSKQESETQILLLKYLSEITKAVSDEKII